MRIYVLIFLSLFFTACSNKTSESIGESVDTLVSESNQVLSGNSEEEQMGTSSFSDLVTLTSKERQAIPGPYCQLLNIVPCMDFINCLDVKPLANNRYFLALESNTGSTATDTQAILLLFEFDDEKVINQNTFDINYQKAPSYSFHHETFFLVEREMKEYEENDFGSMTDTGKPATIERECRILFNGKISPVTSLTKSELSLCRNLIFARYGYQFKLDSLQEYFSKFDWYKPVSSDVNAKLTPEDKTLIDLILKAEKAVQ